jgi:hypothetical protein
MFKARCSRRDVEFSASRNQPTGDLGNSEVQIIRIVIKLRPNGLSPWPVGAV